VVPVIVLPDGAGGWWHRYVCPSHGVELAHEGLLDGTFPEGGAACGYGCRIDDPAVRAAWRALAHQACAREILRLAGTGAMEPARTLLDEYAVRYAELGPHDGAERWMQGGRLFQQALTEAIWATAIGTASWLCGQDPSLRDALAAQLASARDDLVAQGRFASNYTAWFVAAGAVCTRDPHWLTGPDGMFAHVLAGTGADGWEWEGSTYYHAFVLLAYSRALRAIPDVEVPSKVAQRLAAMAQVLRVLSHPGAKTLRSDTLPALHDGPYRRAGYNAELAELDELLPQDGPVAEVTVFDDAGYAVLHGNGVQAIVDYGPHGGSHGHRDKLALYLYGESSPWQPDPGQVPYGHPIWREHYASTAAHPTFSVDGLEQAECSGRLVHADPRRVEVACDEAYPGVRARRRLTLDGGAVVDELTVACDRPRRVVLQLRPDVPLSVSAGEVSRTRWAGERTLRGEHTATSAAWFVSRPGPGPADDPQRTRTWVDWTVPDATEVTYRSVYAHSGES
jgi:hypothetical protein